MATDYDGIVAEYRETKTNPIKRHSEEHTFFQALGDLRGLDVIDLACGDGQYTRALKRRGATRVVGVDRSVGMLAAAQTAENGAPLGILYRQGDITALERLADFDLATMVFVLNGAATSDELSKMARAAWRNLKPGGRLIAVTLAPELHVPSLAALERYNARLDIVGPLQDGALVKVTLATPDGPLELHNHHWSRRALETAFTEAGFGPLVWHEMSVSEEGLAEHGPAYWRAHLEHPTIAVLTTTRLG